ncbi:lysophospholipid acyltransferase family protein [Ovoidimarina sediminis]|uniref:lysophospholipid acyltransferase family protein n=1 Tax=Ovoidimarina sediminis TaxID=3079856 RepID=UPI002911CA27|nr:lysophospholipid acyltransferase family protein [Rhodophyticola sp. MJ-SS7]MDU8945747.1 lysophospholipid acyltransferase family protein [Rhodophyticola sp. MJ-SS7]
MRLADRLMRAFGRVLMKCFFRKIEIEGAQRFPTDGPVIVVANHPNSLIDGVLLSSFLPRHARLLAASILWDYLPLLPLLRAGGVIPVYRRQDVGAQAGRNDGAFRAAVGALSEGQVLALFPEGVSHNAPHLLPLKHGAARIAREALAAGGTEGLRIVPVGLHYDSKTQFRSNARLTIGAPVDPAAYVGAEAPEEGVVQLTEALSARLRDVVEPPVAEVARARVPLARRVLPAAVLALASLPNGLPWLLSRRAAKGKDTDKRATWSLFAALWLFPVGWLAFALAASGPIAGALPEGIPGALAAAAGFAAGPVLGLLGIWAMDRRRGRLEEIRPPSRERP